MYEYFLNLAKQYSKINDWDFDFRSNDKITLNTKVMIIHIPNHKKKDP